MKATVLLCSINALFAASSLLPAQIVHQNTTRDSDSNSGPGTSAAAVEDSYESNGVSARGSAAASGSGPGGSQANAEVSITHEETENSRSVTVTARATASASGGSNPPTTPPASTLRPFGDLGVTSRLVRADSRVTVGWKVEYVSNGENGNLFDVDEDRETVVTSQDADVDVVLLGSSFGRGAEGYDVEFSAKFSDEPTINSNIRTGSGRVSQDGVIKSRENVNAGVKLDLASRGIDSSRGGEESASDWRVMGIGQEGVRVLKNGDSMPRLSSRSNNRQSAGGFLLPYLSEDANTVKIGPNDALVLFEFGETSNQASAGLQDLAVLMTFKPGR